MQPSQLQSPRAAPAASESGGLSLAYRFRAGAELRAIEAQLCFRGPPPAQLSAGFEAASDALREVWSEADGRHSPLAVENGRISLAGVHDGDCIGYTVDLDAVAQTHGFAVERRGHAIVSNIALWLWRPSAWQSLRSATARIELAPGMRASVPWQKEGDRYLLDASAFAFYAYAAFGEFDLLPIAVSGAALEVAVLAGLSASTRAQVIPWLQSAAEMAAGPFGQFPRSRAQVVVLPAGRSSRSHHTGSDDPVPFGTVTRGGGASALMVLAGDAPRGPLLADWVAVHEFSHLLLPFLQREDAWLSEGFATYYQEVLRVRGGTEPEADAWRRLFEGASRGKGMTVSLAQESAAMHAHASYKQVYWAGAAFALLADAELRRGSANRHTLDSALRAVASKYPTQSSPIAANDLLAELDSAVGRPVFTQLAKRWLHGPAFPDLTELYAGLGVRVTAGKVELDSSAAEAWIRDAIMHSPAGGGPER